MESKRRLKKSVVIFIYKILIVAIITLILMIIMKKDVNFKTSFYKYVYDTNLSFDKFTNLYNKYFSDLKVNNKKEEAVSKTNLVYTNVEKYMDGAKFTVGSNYNVEARDSGIIVFVGEKEGYGSTIIIKQSNGVDMWYGNIKDTNYQIYDYVEKGKIIGVAQDYLYVAFKKDGKFLNYEEYL